jgi:hypothetical protein
VAKLSIGIAGSSGTEGATRTHGVPGTAGIMGDVSPAVKTAMYLWFGAVAILFIFHVGGAKLG